MRRDCTELFLRYREIARHVWNTGFLPGLASDRTSIWDAVEIYQESIARLYEGMVLLPLGQGAKIVNAQEPGTAVRFEIEPRVHTLRTRFLHCGTSAGAWQETPDPLPMEGSRFRFVCFFDWDLTGPRDFAYIEAQIERLDAQMDLVGRFALLQIDHCSFWFDDGGGPAQPAS